MKLIRVQNPSGLRANPGRKKGKTMAKRRRRRRTNASVGRPRRVAAKAVNPRRRRRRRNPTTIVTRATRRTINPRRRRRSRRNPAIARRRSNPSGLRIGDLAKKAIYGAGGAILTRAGASLVEGFIPGQFASSPLARPVTQAAVAVIAVRWAGKKFLGQAQADIMMIGGLISAGLAAFDAYLPNAQSQVTNIFRPIMAAPQVVAATPSALAGGMGDVYDVQVLPGSFGPVRGFGDVEEVPMGIFS